MSNDTIVSPEGYPEKAAQQVVLEIIKAGALQGLTRPDAEEAIKETSSFLIGIHKELVSYYESLNRKYRK